MPFRYVVPLAAVVVALVVGLARAPLPADASFHCMRIHAVMGGANGNANIQYVELRMVIADQTFLMEGNTQLAFFGAAGNPTGTYTFTSDPPHGAVAGASILIGTSDFALNSTVPPDYTMPVNVMAPSGKVQFVGTNNCALSGTIIDSVAYGSYTGAVDCPLPAPPAMPNAPSPALPTTGAQALTLDGSLTNQCTSSTTYSLQTAAPRNIAGQTGSICNPGPCPTPAPTPVPTPTPAPTATPPPGDADGDGVPDASDNCPRWPNPAQNLPPWTVPPSDPDCDGFTTAAETFIGTLANVHCAATMKPNDEDPDPWPVDNNDDRKAGLGDILAYIPVYLTTAGDGRYNPRYDLSADGKIGLADILSFIPFYLTTCTP